MIKRVIAGFFRHSGLISLAGAVRRMWRGPRLIVLCYHRVISDSERPAFSALPEEFARQLDWISGRFQVLRLEDVREYLAGRRLHRDSVVITFDDGYDDNIHVVKPMLARRGLPAFFFIASEPLLERRAYWYDELWEALAAWEGLPLPEACRALLPQETLRTLYRFGRTRIAADRKAALEACKGLSGQARRQVLESMGMGRKPSDPFSACETMTLEDARACERQGIEIGAHTRSHPSLARVPADECEREISEGMRDLRAAGFRARYFAYPFGEAQDTGGREGLPRRILAERAGVQVALTTEERAVRPGDDPLLVPRKVIGPQSLSQIALKLEMLSWRR